MAAQSFGEWLRAFREELKIDRATLAEKSGLTDRYLYQLERSGRLPRASQLTKLETALGHRDTYRILLSATDGFGATLDGTVYMNKHLKAGLCYALGFFGYRILKSAMLAQGCSMSEVNYWTNGGLLILVVWITWSWYRHKDDKEKQETRLESAFQEALKEKQTAEKSRQD